MQKIRPFFRARRDAIRAILHRVLRTNALIPNGRHHNGLLAKRFAMMFRAEALAHHLGLNTVGLHPLVNRIVHLFEPFHGYFADKCLDAHG